MKLRVFLLLGTVCWLFSLALAQTSAARAQSRSQQPTEQMPTFTSRTELVLVPVIVRNHGQSVSGLKKEQFTIQDEGKPRDVASFEEVATSTAPLPAPKRTAVEFSNYVSDPQAARRLTIILLDLLHTPYLKQQRARKYLLKYLSTHVSANEPTALLVLNRYGLRQVHSFSTTTKVLLDAVNGVQSETQTLAADPEVMAEMGALRQAVFGVGSFEEMRQQSMSESALDTFTAIAQSYAGIPGRKALIWISGGFPFPNPMSTYGMDRIHSMQSTWKALNGANVAVYPVDVNGLLASAFPIPFLGAATHDTFRDIADATGGRACINNNDIAQCIERSVNDAAAYYLLGFYVPAGDRTPGWHRIKVKLNAKYSDLRYREGYLSGGTTVNYRAALVNGLFYSPLDFTALSIDVAITGIENAGDGRKVKFNITVPPNSLSVDRDQNNLMELRYSLVVFDSRNISVGQQTHTLHGNPKPETLATIMQQGLTHPWDIDVAPGKYQFKWIVTDNLSGRWGSVTAIVDVK